MVIVVYGDDGFRVRERVREMREAFVKKFDPTGLNVSVFPADDQAAVTPGAVLQAAGSLPFLAPKRLVIVREAIAGLRKEAERAWIDGVGRVPDSSILIFWETADAGAVEKSALFKRLKETADMHVYPFPTLQGAALAEWIAQRAGLHGAKIEPDAVRALMERVGSDLWQLDGELGKLAGFAVGAPITAAMVRELVRASFEGQIFALVDAISRREPHEALKLLEQERQAGSDDFYLLSMLARQVRLLIGVRALLDERGRATPAEAAEALGCAPFVAGKALAQARGFTIDDLHRTHDLLYAYDVALKSGRLDAALAVDLVALDLLRAES